MSFIKSAALIAALALTTAPVALAERPTVRQVTVSYGDLNLQNKAGIDALFVRIGSAARKVCGDRPAHILAGALTRYTACRETVTGQTVRSINIPTVTVAWAEMSHEPIQTASR